MGRSDFSALQKQLSQATAHKTSLLTEDPQGISRFGWGRGSWSSCWVFIVLTAGMTLSIYTNFSRHMLGFMLYWHLHFYSLDSGWELLLGEF